MDKGLLDLVVPRSFLKGALFEMMDFYKAAPFKRRGRVPFGVQHGMFMNTEERVRRRVRDWAAARSGGGSAAALTAGGSSPSFQELVESFQVRAPLCVRSHAPSPC